MGATKRPERPITEAVAEDMAARAFTTTKGKTGTVKNPSSTVSFRLPESERTRVQRILEENGFTLAQGAKTALFQFIKTLETQGRGGR